MKKWALGIVVVLAAVGALAFEPWTAFTSSTIDEALPPGSEVSSTPALTATSAPSASTSSATTPEATPEPKQNPAGEFVDAEHGTSGTARILELANGKRYLRIENLATSNGPDLHVWLSDRTAGGSWFKYDDGDYLKLGELKATNGNQNYEIPADADLTIFKSAVIWCDRFNVAFGAAPIAVTG